MVSILTVSTATNTISTERNKAKNFIKTITTSRRKQVKERWEKRLRKTSTNKT